MQKGVDIWQVAGYVGMTAQVLERVYGHHAPDWMEDAANA